MCGQSLSHVPLFETPWIPAGQAPLSMGLSRQEYWSGLPFPLPDDLPDTRMEPMPPAVQVDSLPWSHLGRPILYTSSCGPRMLLRWVFCSSLPITPGVVLTGRYPLWDARLSAPLGTRGGFTCLTHVRPMSDPPTFQAMWEPMTCSSESWNSSGEGLPCLSSLQAEKSPRRESTPMDEAPLQAKISFFDSFHLLPPQTDQLGFPSSAPSALSSHWPK